MKAIRRTKTESATSSRIATTRSTTSPRSRNGSIPAELAELIEISHAVGRDLDLVQGGGGNTSVKSADGRVMFIKTSGSFLAEMSPERGWAELSLQATRAVMQQGLAELPAAEREARVLQLLQLCVIKPYGARPSVESNLHALLGRVVIHTHPVGLNALLCAKGSRQKLGEAIGAAIAPEHGLPLCIPYVDPGYTLAARVEAEIATYCRRHNRTPAVVVLENHGLFVAGADVETTLKLSARITAAGAVWSGLGAVNADSAAGTSAAIAEAASLPGSAEVRGALLRGGSAPVLVRRDNSTVARSLLADAGAMALVRKGTFTPDQIVYCRAQPLILDGATSEWPRKVSASRDELKLDPRVVLVKPEPRKSIAGGIYYAAPDVQQLQVVGHVYRSAIAVLLAAKQAGGPRFLAGAERAFIESWEVEKFRAGLLNAAEAKLAGKIAAVTGAGSGLGKGIARGLARAGATVLALDLNQSALEAAQAEMPAGKYLPCAGDVTSEESMAQAFGTLESLTGGIDILVNAAGIAPSFPLTEFPLGAWRKTLDINLTGYFLCAREAVRLMKRQGSGGSIVNLTSKSGLEASKENSAYNATKAGEIHLMRGWALELGSAGIRVNCVAPGNVFKGSQIWNAEYIKACAKKKGIKPEEVIPYYTSLAPLGKEIEPEDIANAVVFLVSDEARNITGQTLVVDGGQVMVR